MYNNWTFSHMMSVWEYGSGIHGIMFRHCRNSNTKKKCIKLVAMRTFHLFSNPLAVVVPGKPWNHARSINKNAILQYDFLKIYLRELCYLSSSFYLQMLLIFMIINWLGSYVYNYRLCQVHCLISFPNF